MVSLVGTATANSQAGPASGGVNPSATFNFNGGTLKARTNSATFFQGSIVAPIIPITTIVKSRGAIIDDGGFAISVLEPLQHDSTLGGTPDGGLFKKGSGTLTLTAASTYTGGTFVSNGTLVVNGSLGATVVTVANNATLAGTGTVGGNVTVNAGGALAPAGVGATGTLTLNGNLGLQGTTLADINASTLGNDIVLLNTGTVTYGGALTVTNLAGTLASGNSFRLFNAAGYAGSFSATNLPALTAGLAWNWNPANGTLSVVSGVSTTSTNITVMVGTGTMTLSWPADHTGWRLQAQTNSTGTGLGTNWSTVPGSTSVNNVTVPLNPANPTVFYRMVYP
jgi:autotransporter-associated beta strand protein